MRLRSVLLIGVASGVLLASAGGTAAEEFTFAGPTGNKSLDIWEAKANWTSGGAPAAVLPAIGDTLTVSAGSGSLGVAMSVDTLNHEGGNTAIGHYGVLNVSTFNLSGGKYKQSNGGPLPAFLNGPPGITNISTLFNITGGTLSGQGQVNVGPGGTVTQSGGQVDGGTTITTPSYTQTGGNMSTLVVTSSYSLSGDLIDDEPSATMSGTVTLGTLFTLSGDGARVTGGINGDGDAAMVQTGGQMDGWAGGLASYSQSSGAMSGDVSTQKYYVSGGSVSGRIDFSELFAMSGDDTTVEWMHLVGARDAVMTQSGGHMGGAVYNEFLDVNSVGIATYSQSGGEMSGFVVADTYELSGGSISGSVEFADLFALSADGNVAWGSYLRGDGDAAVMQSAGTMEGEVTGISTYSQSGGDMAGAVSTGTYALSGGTVSGYVAFSELFAVSGTGTVNSTARLSQSGGIMASNLGTIDSYTQSGGLITGKFTTETYELADGDGDGFENVAIGRTFLQSGGVFDRDGLVVPIFTQSGGLFSGTISVETYNLIGANAVSTGGTIDASQAFNLAPESGTAVLDALLSGNGGIVKSGASTVVLTNAGNSFTGGVAINEGTLDVLNDALTDGAAVAIDPDAILKLTTTTDTLYTGTMTGEQGDLVKAGAATATLAGNISLGDLWLDAGRLNIGTGISSNEAVFDSATVAWGSTLYIAKNATLTIRKPEHLVNNGNLINDGTVHDDLDNTGTFANNQVYNANVATNTGTINNNTPGVWTGNITTNAGTINNNAGSTWHGDVQANAGTISNSGTWVGNVLTNVGYIRNYGSWTGRIDMNTYKDIYNSGAAAVWTGDVINNTQIVNTSGAHWNGKVQGNNNVVFNMAGSFWNGDVVANGGGSNSLAQIDNYGTWTGDVVTNADMIFNIDGTWTGDILGNTDSVYNNLNDSNTNPTGANLAVWDGEIRGNNGYISNENLGIWLHGDIYANGSNGTIGNRGAWTGDVKANAGTIWTMKGTWTGDVEANTGIIHNNRNHPTLNVLGANQAVWNGDVVTNSGLIRNDTAGIWNGNVLANTGTITTAGVWTGAFTSAGTVNAQNQIVGAFTNSGLLHLTGSLAGITTLSNTGSIDLTSNGAAQTLTVASVTFGGNSVLKLDVDITGHSDRIVVAGAATLGGSVYLSGTQASGMASFTTPYEFLTAASVTGTFTGVTTDLAFLNPTLTYDADSAFVTLARNAQTFTAVGTTVNQKDVAAGIEALGVGNDIYDAVLFLSQDEAQSAFDQLSGEAYASVETASIESAGMIGDIGMNRVAQLFGGVADGEGSASGYAGSAVLEARAPTDTGFWTQFYGAVGIVAASQSASAVDSSTGGVAFGLDGELDEWRLGMMLHAGITTTTVAALDAVSTSIDYGIGVYGGRQWGDTSLSLGATYTRHAIRSTRSVTFPGFTDNLSAAYAAGTAQAMAQLSREFDLGAMSLTPYASLAYVNHLTDGFVEAGGAASLASAPSVVNATFATLGVSVDQQFVVGDDMLLTAMASMGWRHTFADSPNASHSFAGGTSFSVVGSPVVNDMVVFAAGLNLDVSSTTNLDLSYDGQIGGGSQTHALQGTWATSF